MLATPLDPGQLEAVQAARKHAAWHSPGSFPCLSLSGPDALPFLQRQTSNDVHHLNQNRVVTTAFLEATAKFIDLVEVVQVATNHLELIPVSLDTARLGGYLKSKIFFMDKVEITSSPENRHVLDLEGPTARETLSTLNLPAPEIRMNAASQHIVADGQSATIWARQGLSSALAYRIYGPPSLLATLESELRKNIPHLGQPELQALRLEAGAPAWGKEITPDYTPLEVGLDWVVSDDKGCYTGQEILARQITYDKVVRHSACLASDSPLMAGYSLYAGERRCGKVTSAGLSTQGEAIGIGILNRPYHQPGTQLLAHNKEGAAQKVLVTDPIKS